jgi:hypothetical protein
MLIKKTAKRQSNFEVGGALDKAHSQDALEESQIAGWLIREHSYVEPDQSLE